jgi:hypothetical protein
VGLEALPEKKSPAPAPLAPLAPLGRRLKQRVARGRGVLKRQVPLWLSLPQFRSLVVGFEDAHLGHGGEGALYVRLRRTR